MVNDKKIIIRLGHGIRSLVDEISIDDYWRIDLGIDKSRYFRPVVLGGFNVHSPEFPVEHFLESWFTRKQVTGLPGWLFDNVDGFGCCLEVYHVESVNERCDHCLEMFDPGELGEYDIGPNIQLRLCTQCGFFRDGIIDMAKNKIKQEVLEDVGY